MGSDQLSEIDYNKDFWCEIEEEIGGNIPDIVKVVLSKCGYEIRVCLGNLTNVDIGDIENHARAHLYDKLKRWLKNDKDYEKMSPSEFMFLPGHRKIISLIQTKLSAAPTSEIISVSTANSTEPETEPDPLMKSRLDVLNLTMSIAQEAALESELCKHIRGWMVNKNFHASVSILTYDRFNMFYSFEHGDISYSRLVFFMFFKMWESINNHMILHLVRYKNANNETEHKCQFRCPACSKMMPAIHKVYNVAKRKRKNNEPKPVKSRRKHVWYFSNVQSHLLRNHLYDRIEIAEEIDAFGDQANSEDLAEPESTSSENGDIALKNGTEDLSTFIEYDPNGATDNSKSSTHAEQPRTEQPRTPKKNIAQRFFEQLENKKKTVPHSYDYTC